jgi:hypothetical protein
MPSEDNRNNKYLTDLADGCSIRYIEENGIVYFCVTDANRIFEFNLNVSRYVTSLAQDEKYMVKARREVWYMTSSVLMRQLKKKIDSGTGSDVHKKMHSLIESTMPTAIQLYDTGFAGPMAVWERKDWLTDMAPRLYVGFLSDFKLIPYNTLRTQIVGSETGLPLFPESPINFHIRSLLPFVDFHIMRQVFTEFMSDYLFCQLYENNRRTLLNCNPGFVTPYEEELREEMIRFELRNNLEPISIALQVPGKPDSTSYQRIVFLTPMNYRRYGNAVGTSLEGYMDYIEKNYEKFSEETKVAMKPIQKYYYEETKYDGHLHEDIFVPYHRLCDDLRVFVTKRGMTGLNFQVSPDDYARCIIKEWYMEKKNEIIHVFYREGKKKHFAQYYIMERLISAYPEERFLITPSMHYTNLCRDFLVINRLQTTHVGSTVQRPLSQSELQSNFNKYAEKKYDALITLFNDHVVVNGCGEFVPDYSTMGPWRDLKLGADWIEEKDYASVGICERYNIFPNNDVKPKIVMAELERAVLQPSAVIPSYVQLGDYYPEQRQIGA